MTFIHQEDELWQEESDCKNPSGAGKNGVRPC